MYNSKNNWAIKVKKWVLNRPIVIIAGLIVVFASSTITILDATSRFSNYFNYVINWRNSEENIINSLSTNINISVFKDKLGSPVYISGLKGSKSIEYFFKRKGYWIQAVANDFGQVSLMAITVCDVSFKPKISFVKKGTFDTDIVIGGTTLYEMSKDPSFNYFIGAHPPNVFMEHEYLARPGGYQEAYWGVNDVCPYFMKDIPESIIDNKVKNLSSPEIVKFRKSTRINMFAISYDFDYENIAKSNPVFIIGGNSNIFMTFSDN